MEGVCEFCDQDSFGFEREVIKLVVRKLVEADTLTTGVISGIRREAIEHRPIEKKLEKFVGLVSRGTLRDFGDALNKILDDAGYLAEDDQIPCSEPMPIEDLD